MKSFKLYIIKVLLLLLAGASLSQPSVSLRQEIRRLSYQVKLLENYTQLLPNSSLVQQFKSQIQMVREEIRTARRFVQLQNFPGAKEHLRNARMILMLLEETVIRKTRFQVQLKKGLDGIIQRAENIIQQTQNPTAKQLLEQAKAYWRRAIIAYQRQVIFQAIEFYRLAEYFARNAIDLATRGEENVENLFHRTWTLLNDLQTSPIGTERNLQPKFVKFRHQLKTVKQYIDEGRFQQARRMLQMLNFELYQLLAEKSPTTVHDRKIQKRWEVVQQNLRRLQQKQMNGNEMWQRLLSQAQRLARRVNDAMERKEYRVAQKKMNVLIQLLYRLETLASNAVAHDAVQQELELKRELKITQQLITTLKHNTDIKNSPYFTLLNHLILEAQKLIQKHQWVAASNLLKVTNQLIMKYYQTPTTGTNENTMQQAERYIQRLRKLIKKMLPTHGNVKALRLARELLKTAEQLYAQGHFQKAKALSEYGLRLLTQ